MARSRTMLAVMSRTPARIARQKKKRFLEALTRTCNVTASCEFAGLARETAYFWRGRSRDFSAAWDAALERGLDALEDEVMRRAKDGVSEPVFYQGQVVGATRRYSDSLAMFILKSKRREIWGERQQIDIKDDWTQMTVEQRERRVLELLDMLEEHADRARLINQPRPLPPGAVRVGDYIYDPTDGDELAAREAAERAKLPVPAESSRTDSMGPD